MKRYRGWACGIGMTARTYATVDEAICAARKMAQRHMRRMKANGPLPDCTAGVAA
jgi:hypothetical protein